VLFAGTCRGGESLCKVNEDSDSGAGFGFGSWNVDLRLFFADCTFSRRGRVSNQVSRNQIYDIVLFT
jgi:hypothetical protein